jgi:hypothetical protein
LPLKLGKQKPCEILSNRLPSELIYLAIDIMSTLLKCNIHHLHRAMLGRHYGLLETRQNTCIRVNDASGLTPPAVQVLHPAPGRWLAVKTANNPGLDTGKP